MSYWTLVVAAALAALSILPVQAGTWGAARTLEGPAAVSSPPEPPLVVMNAGGDAMAAWNLSGAVRYAEQRTGRRGWTVSRVVPGGGSAAGPLAVALGRSGAAAIAWTTVATRYVPSALRVSLRAPGGRFARGVDVGPGTGLWTLRASVACDGSVTLLWLDAQGVRSMQLPGEPGAGPCDGRPGAGPWSAPVVLSAGQTGATLPDLAANDDGAAVAGWQAGSAAYAALRPAGASTWLPAQQLNPGSAAAVWNARPVIDAAGRPAVGYLEGSSMKVVRGDATGTWGAPVQVSGAQQQVYIPALAGTAAGDLVAAWQVLDAGTLGTVWRAEGAAAGGAWSAPARVSTLAEDAAWPAVAVAPDGGAAFIAWVDQTTNTARAANRDAGPWRTQTLGPGWWGSTVPVAAGNGAGVAGWARTEGGNPNAAVLVGRTWR